MISVVIPTFNERENVTELCDRIDGALRGLSYEAIFVDDSTDDTPAALKGLADARPCVRFEHRSQASGLASAVARGFQLARGQVIAVMDGDLQHPPELLPALCQEVCQGADICLASRFIPGGDDGGLNAYRKFVSWTARMLGKAALPGIRRISDPTTGFFAFDARLLEGAQLRPIGWKILIELLAVCRYERVVEIPMVFGRRKGGGSKLSAKPVGEYLEQLRSLRSRAVRQRRVQVERALGAGLEAVQAP